MALATWGRDSGRLAASSGSESKTPRFAGRYLLVAHMPVQHAPFHGYQQAIERVSEKGQGEDARVHLVDFECPLAEQDVGTDA